MTEILGFSSFKGGTGKTTLSYAMAERGYSGGFRTLMLCQHQLKIERFRQLRIDLVVVGGKFRHPRIDPPPFSCSAKTSVV